MKLHQNRLDPSDLTPNDLREVERLLAQVDAPQRPALVGASGERLELPEAVFEMLVQVLRSMRERRAIMLLPEDEAFTSQAAADYLGVSRPFLIGLLKKGAISFHFVGSHRRVAFKDLLDYEKKRDDERRTAMADLLKEVNAGGLDDASYTGE